MQEGRERGAGDQLYLMVKEQITQSDGKDAADQLCFRCKIPGCKGFKFCLFEGNCFASTK